MNIKDEIYPKVKADVRMTDDKTLWVKVSKPEFEKIGRIILEDGNIFCKVFYQDAEPRIIHCKDCEWWEKLSDSIQGRCELMQMYPTGTWFCGNAQLRGESE